MARKGSAAARANRAAAPVNEPLYAALLGQATAGCALADLLEANGGAERFLTWPAAVVDEYDHLVIEYRLATEYVRRARGLALGVPA